MILLLLLCVMITGCSTNNATNSPTNNTQAEAKQSSTEAAEQQDSAEHVVAAYLDARMRDDIETMGDLIIPSYFNDATQGTLSKEQWIANNKAILANNEGATVKEYSIIRTGEVNPKVAKFVAGEPKTVYEVKLLFEQNGIAQWSDPNVLFVTEDQGKWWISLEANLLSSVYDGTLWIGSGTRFDRLTDHSEFADR